MQDSPDLILLLLTNPNLNPMGELTELLLHLLINSLANKQLRNVKW